MSPYWLFIAGVVLALLCALSLFAKTEGFRGSGRVAGGFSTILLAVAFFLLTRAGGLLPPDYAVPAILLGVSGLITVGSGARKFFRRHIEDSN